MKWFFNSYLNIAKYHRYEFGANNGIAIIKGTIGLCKYTVQPIWTIKVVSGFRPYSGCIKYKGVIPKNYAIADRIVLLRVN